MNAQGQSSLANKKVLILDGETRSALAVARSLGKAGCELTVAANRTSLAGSSRYAAHRLANPDARQEPEAFKKWLLETVSHSNFDFLLPITSASLRLALEIQDKLPKSCCLPAVPASTFSAVEDKRQLLTVADELKINRPQTVVIPKPVRYGENLEAQIRGFPYPACLKPAISEFPLEVQNGQSFVRETPSYPRTSAEVFHRLRHLADKQIHVPLLLQEYVEGVGVGVFAVCRNGAPVLEFAHRRILEKPPSGGVSVLCESIPLSNAPITAPVTEARALLKHFEWNGVAMVEFKIRPDGSPCLMEINPRFWGSLQLAIDCGCDFPKTLLETFSSDSSESNTKQEPQQYVVGQRLRWELGTLDHMLIRLLRNPGAALADFLFQNGLHFSLDSKTKWEMLRKEDFRPFLSELRQYMISSAKSLLSPHQGH